MINLIAKAEVAAFIQSLIYGSLNDFKIRSLETVITGCKSDMWNCLDCKRFIPDREQLPYFREQVLAWQTKAEKFKDYPMIKTNAMRNAELFEKIVKKLMEGDYHA